MSHFPDRVLGGVPASGYVKIQDYVSYTGWGSGHFQDPSLLAVSTSPSLDSKTRVFKRLLLSRYMCTHRFCRAV